MTEQKFTNLDEKSAVAFLRESSIQRQHQALSDDQVSDIRSGKQDQSLGYDDAIFGLTNANAVWPQVQQQMGKQSA